MGDRIRQAALRALGLEGLTVQLDALHARVRRLERDLAAARPEGRWSDSPEATTWSRPRTIPASPPPPPGKGKR